MIQFFEHISELSVSAGISFRICLSSRHYPHITIKRGLGLVLEGQEGHTQDITNYLESELKIGKSKLAQQVREEIQEKASGVFMWVALVVGILNKEHDRGRMHALRRRLQEIPGDLHELFRDILLRDSNNKDELVLCIQWVLYAKQPLTPEQLYFAILSGSEPDIVSEWDHDEITEDVMRRFILDSSKGLAEVTSKLRKVQFIHESVRDFLLKDDGLGSIWPELRQNFQGQSHNRLRDCCMGYINTVEASRVKVLGSHARPTSQYASEFCQSALRTFPLLGYTVQDVLYHADTAEGSGVTQEAFLRNFPLHHWITLDNLFEKFEIRRHTEDVSLLYILGEHNMANLIKIHPWAASCLQVEQERYGPPLFAALATGSKEAVEAFIGVLYHDLSTRGPPHGTYSQYLGGEGISDKFGRDFKFSKRKTVLSYIAEYGDPTLLAVALRPCKAEVDVMDEKTGTTPLLRAVRENQEAVVGLLLEIGKANVNLAGRRGQPLLFEAIECEHDAIVKLVLNTGLVNVNQTFQNWTPLVLAAKNGCDKIVKLLLDTGKVDVDWKDPRLGQSALAYAASYGNEEVVKSLLSTGMIDVNQLSAYDDSTPLILAARKGFDKIVKLLLDTGKVNVNCFRNEFGLSLLAWAAFYRHEKVMKSLLDTNEVNFHSMNREGGIQLKLAAKNGHQAVMKVLLDTNKVDPNVKGVAGQTLIERATSLNNAAMVELFLDTGKVDINNKNASLLMAAADGRLPIVKMILVTDGVDVNSKDSPFKETPLHKAASMGHDAVVKLLLQVGSVDVNLQDQFGRTPLWTATWYNHEAIVKLLLDTGKVDVNLKDWKGETPLSLARKKLHEPTVRLLALYADIPEQTDPAFSDLRDMPTG